MAVIPALVKADVAENPFRIAEEILRQVDGQSDVDPSLRRLVDNTRALLKSLGSMA
jgi:hypothetical protein